MAARALAGILWFTLKIGVDQGDPRLPERGVRLTPRRGGGLSLSAGTGARFSGPFSRGGVMQRFYAAVSLWHGASIAIDGGEVLTAERGDIVLLEHPPHPLPPGWRPGRLLVGKPVRLEGSQAA